MTRAFARPCYPLFRLLQVSSIIERTYPGSHSYRVIAEDGAVYIMKVFPSNQARTLTCNEVFANTVGVSLGFSMAHWSALQLDDQTRDEYLGAHESNEIERGNLSEQIYFGTRIMNSPGCPRPWLSNALMRKNAEVARQIGCIRIFDAWLAYDDIRQYAAMVEAKHPLCVYFFGNSRILNPENPALFQHRMHSISDAASSDPGGLRSLDEFLYRLSKYRDQDLREAARAVPDFWRDRVWEARALRFLQLRRDSITSMWRSGLTHQRIDASHGNPSHATLLR